MNNHNVMRPVHQQEEFTDKLKSGILYRIVVIRGDIMAKDIDSKRTSSENAMQQSQPKQAVLTQKPEEVPNLPRYALGALRHATSKEPHERFASCSDFAAALGGQKVGDTKRQGGRSVWFAVAAVALLAVLVAGWYGSLHKVVFNGNVALPGGVILEMVKIPAGEFLRDDGKMVRLTKSYWLGKYEVTNEQWRAVMSGRRASQDGTVLSDPSKWKESKRPVEGVSWNDAMDFCKRLNELYADQLPRGYRIDLPTEAQWEYACRAGTTTNYSYGNASDTDKMNFEGNYPYGGGSKGVYRAATVDVGSLGYKNAFGLYDMHGNVWEWCRDWYETYGSDTTDPTGPATGSKRVARGGSWNDYSSDCRSVRRFNFDPGCRLIILGFRLALVPVQWWDKCPIPLGLDCFD